MVTIVQTYIRFKRNGMTVEGKSCPRVVAFDFFSMNIAIPN